MIEFLHRELIADVRKKRLSNNLSYRKASKEIGIDQCTFYRLENGTIPTIDNLCKICTWLNIIPYTYFKNV